MHSAAPVAEVAAAASVVAAAALVIASTPTTGLSTRTGTDAVHMIQIRAGVADVSHARRRAPSVALVKLTFNRASFNNSHTDDDEDFASMTMCCACSAGGGGGGGGSVCGECA